MKGLNTDQLFHQIAEELTHEENVILGKMMSSPGLKYKNKVFAFYHEQKMCFKLEDPSLLDILNISEYDLLSPFKTKPPLKGWYYINSNYSNLWPKLAEESLVKMKERLSR